MENKKIVLLAGRCDSTNIVFNAINKNFGICTAIMEEREPAKKFLKRRISRLGLFTVLGQIAFQLFIAKPLGYFSQKRKQEIFETHGMDANEIPTDKITAVPSVNAASTIALLKELNPDLIIVNGTRIIAQKVLSSIQCPFINTHAGITPKYRGVHGTYWALVNDDAANSGVTVHLVDAGIDTGNIIAQAQVMPTANDNFFTYPYLQLAQGVKLLNTAVQDFFTSRLTTRPEAVGESKLWYHPTIFQYLYYRLVKKIK